MINVKNLKYTIGNFALDISISINDAEYFVLLGMTGSGKTLFLENLCGLREPTQGQVFIKDSDITNEEPRKRGIGYVPQDGALFSHLNVMKNIGFSLKVRGIPSNEREEKVTKIATILGISHLLRRHINGLSGGERQRVALARALICYPSVLLLDEPVSALDEYTRESVCYELTKLQRSLNLTVIHVCHSFEEVKLVADQVGIMQKGRIVQTGTPDELLNSPASIHVANILRLKNIFRGKAVIENNIGIISCNGINIKAAPFEGDVTFFIRPWQIKIAGNQVKEDMNLIEGNIKELDFTGPLAQLRIDGPLPLCFYLLRQEIKHLKISIGTKIKLICPLSSIHLLTE